MAILSDTVQAVRLGAVQALNVSATATTATALAARFVEVVSDKSVHLVFGAGPTAATTDKYLPAGVVQYFKIIPNELASILSATEVGAGTVGNVWITEITE